MNDDLFGFLEDLPSERRARIEEFCSRIPRDRLAELLKGIPPHKRADILEMANVDMHKSSPLAEQLEMAYRDVSRFDDNVELSTAHQKKIDWVLTQHRARTAHYPIMYDGVLGGPDGTHIVGNPNARWISLRGSPDLPTYDPNDPQQTQVPMIVAAWYPDVELAVRSPNSIEDFIGDFEFPPNQPCDWHFGTAKTGKHSPGVLVRTNGQYIVLMHVCGSCRDILSRMYGSGLLFFELDENRRVQVPRLSKN